MSGLDRIGDYLSRRCGFQVPDLRTLRKAVEQRVTATAHASVAEYGVFLQGNPQELRELINLVVVPETFFFRYPSSFCALADWALARPVRPLRILSLACSTGEEPYTIAMTLLDAGLDESTFFIEARDISTAALEIARRGLYGSKSFRDVTGNWRERYFSSEGPDWQVSARLRKLVGFGFVNLLEFHDQAAWDAIFCRNSLIYFPPAEQRRIAGFIDRALVEDGIIFVGPSEPPLFIDDGWAPSGYPMSFSCVRRAKATPRSVSRPLPKIVPRAKPAAALVRETPSAPLVAARRPAVSLDTARKLADEGQLDEAQAMLSDALRENAANAEALFLQGVVEEARGHLDLAEANYRKAIYLQPTHADALQHMALLLQSQGRAQAASHLNRRASRHAAA